MNSDHPPDRLLPRSPLGKIDVSRIDGVWGWEAYLAGSGADEDSADCHLADPGDVSMESNWPTDEQLILGVSLGLCNPLDPGCELEIHREGGQPTRYVWQGARDDDTSDYDLWKKSS